MGRMQIHLRRIHGVSVSSLTKNMRRALINGLVFLSGSASAGCCAAWVWVFSLGRYDPKFALAVGGAYRIELAVMAAISIVGAVEVVLGSAGRYLIEGTPRGAVSLIVAGAGLVYPMVYYVVAQGGIVIGGLAGGNCGALAVLVVYPITVGWWVAGIGACQRL